MGTKVPFPSMLKVCCISYYATAAWQEIIMCGIIIGIPRNSYEQNVTETFFSIYILLFKVDQSV